MARIRIVEALRHEGPAFMEHTEDGPQATWNVQVVAIAEDGREFAHFQAWRPSRGIYADALAAKVTARGYIDTAHWSELEPHTSLEERWDMMAQQEDEVRHGCRSEADLYHGIPYR